MIVCPTCKNVSQEDQKFCIFCGEYIGSSSLEVLHEEVEYAGFWLRLAARLLDGLILILISSLWVLISILLFGDFNGAAKGLYYTLIFLTSWLYTTMMESSKKQATVGKLAVGIQVTDENGNGISFGKACGRYFAKILSNLTLYIGYLMAGWTKRKQALHDMAAGCLVVKK